MSMSPIWLFIFDTDQAQISSAYFKKKNTAMKICEKTVIIV